jgi:NAD(P)-dependent dehydrogenase (short-subunit alcohol dehydrogenase family)
MSQQLKNFHVIITGGTGGLGTTVVSEYIKSGAAVVTNYRSAEKMKSLEDAVGSSERLTGIQADLTSEKEVQSFFQEYQRKYKRLDVLVHTLGGFWMGAEIADTSLQDWYSMQNLNLTSTFLCTREAFRIMKSQCSGKIFTVSSQTIDTFPGKMGAYAVSKTGVMALSRVLANEGKIYNIQVNNLVPSIIDTAENRKNMPDADFSKWVTPKDIALLLVQLSKPESRALSHTVLRVYGKM